MTSNSLNMWEGLQSGTNIFAVQKIQDSKFILSGV